MNEIVLGCDPEFILERGGSIVPARDLLQGSSAFGCDGCDTVGEMRPGHSDDIFELVAKIREIMRVADESKKLKDLRWLAGHCKHGYPIGGHIHIAYPSASSKSRTLGRYLDVFLSDCLSDLIDPLDERMSRQSRGYGQKAGVFGGAIEVKNHDRFEYRTPGSWLVHPLVTLTNFAIAKTVTLGFIKDVLPKKIRRNTVSEKRDAVNDLWSKIPDLPEDIKKSHELVNRVLYAETPIDWSADFKEVWL